MSVYVVFFLRTQNGLKKQMTIRLAVTGQLMTRFHGKKHNVCVYTDQSAERVDS